jgi:lipoprotein-anchoring transpeptidase ErfK/SrfK
MSSALTQVSRRIRESESEIVLRRGQLGELGSLPGALMAAPGSRTVKRAGRFVIQLMMILLLAATATATAARPSSRVQRSTKATQELAELDHNTEAYSRPKRHSKAITIVSVTRPLTGVQTVLPVIAHATDVHGESWLKVLLPGRPNSHTGWILASSTTERFTKWRLTVSLSTRRVTVFAYDRPVRSFEAIVGKPSTPTPTGHFFVEEGVRLSEPTAGAPYALALSGRSDVLKEFDGGPGQIAIHGTYGLVGRLGTNASHGCIRLQAQNVIWLSKRIGPGVPVTITR